MITKEFFGMHNNKEVYAYTLTNANGMHVKISSYGGAVMQIFVPDKKGAFTDVICGYDDLQSYENGDGYQGALIGRTGNRIAKGKFTLDGKTYQLFLNNNENSLHGGEYGFSTKVWDVTPFDGEEPYLELQYTSIDMEENYPGTLKVKVVYTLTKDNGLSIAYEATTDKKTIVNLTNHTYFNLGGYASGKVYDHILQMDADTFLPTDSGLIPTGEIRSVEGTPFDFRKAKTIGKDFDLEKSIDMKMAGGYDHCLNFVGGAQKEPVRRITVEEPKSGRVMEVYTDQPSVQFYTGNFLTNEKYPFKGGYPQGVQNAFCLETQKMPDSINHENFTNVVLNPGEVYKHYVAYKFSVNK